MKTKTLRKGQKLWICLNDSIDWGPKNRGNSSVIGSNSGIKKCVIPHQGDPRRWIQVEIIESKGYWKIGVEE